MWEKEIYTKASWLFGVFVFALWNYYSETPSYWNKQPQSGIFFFLFYLLWSSIFINSVVSFCAKHRTYFHSLLGYITTLLYIWLARLNVGGSDNYTPSLQRFVYIITDTDWEWRPCFSRRVSGSGGTMSGASAERWRPLLKPLQTVSRVDRILKRDAEAAAPLVDFQGKKDGCADRRTAHQLI